MSFHRILVLTSAFWSAAAGPCGELADAMGSTCGENASVWCGNAACETKAASFMASCSNDTLMKVPSDMVKSNMPCIPTGCAAIQNALGSTCGQDPSAWCNIDACKSVASNFLAECEGDIMMKVPVDMIKTSMSCIADVCPSKQKTLGLACAGDPTSWCEKDECKAVAEDFYTACKDDPMMTVPVRVITSSMPCVAKASCTQKQNDLQATCGEDPEKWCLNEACIRVSEDFLASCESDVMMKVPVGMVQTMPCVATCKTRQGELGEKCTGEPSGWCGSDVCKESATSFVAKCSSDVMMTVPLQMIETYMEPCVGASGGSPATYGAAAGAPKKGKEGGWKLWQWLLLLMGVCCVCPCVGLACSAFLCYESVSWIFGGDKPQKKKKARAVKVADQKLAAPAPAPAVPLVAPYPTPATVRYLPVASTHVPAASAQVVHAAPAVYAAPGGVAPAMYAPAAQSYAPQAYAAQSYAPQAYAAQGYAPQ